MRHLGIDYGEKRIGIALSDPEGKIAFPKTVVTRRSTREVIEEIVVFIQKENVGYIVVGLPMGLDGKDTKQTAEVRMFAEHLKKITTLPMVFENEMFTTKMVRRGGIKKEHADASAAALILQSYLDKH